MRHRDSNPHGFTLIELMVASALAAALMVVVMSVLALWSMRQKELGRLAISSNLPAERLARLLEWDLANASHLNLRSEVLVLSGFGNRSPDAEATTHWPTDVMYRVESHRGRGWLIRRQTLRDTLHEHRDLVTPIYVDVARLHVDVTTSEPLVAGQVIPVPPVVNIRLWDLQGQTVLNQTFHVH